MDCGGPQRALIFIIFFVVELFLKELNLGCRDSLARLRLAQCGMIGMRAAYDGNS
jgi:hypothetical protein